MGRVSFTATLALIITASPLCVAQEDPQTFKVDVRLVRMLVTVKNTKGEPIGTLDKSAFTVSDNGVPQEITLFDRQSSQPLSVAVLFDTSLSTISDSKYKRAAMQKFLKAMFQEGNSKDTAAIYSFNESVTLEANYTRSVGRLNGALGRLGASGGTALYDAIFLASRDLERRDGRHVVIVVSDGGDTSSKVDFHGALQAMHRANAVFYSVVVVPITVDAGRNMKGENALITLATWTGGRVFFPTVGAALERTFADILSDLRTQYQIGYYPRNTPTGKDRFHRVKVEVNNPDLSVSARNGYYVNASELP